MKPVSLISINTRNNKIRRHYKRGLLVFIKESSSFVAFAKGGITDEWWSQFQFVYVNLYRSKQICGMKSSVDGSKFHIMNETLENSLNQQTLEMYWFDKFKTVILFQVIVRISTPDSHPAAFNLLLVLQEILLCLTRL